MEADETRVRPRRREEEELERGRSVTTWRASLRVLPVSIRESRRWVLLLIGVACLAWGCPAAEEPRTLTLATTTSVRDSGLLDVLLPTFERETGIEVRIVAVGTGAALRMGREGNADVLLTHAPPQEKALLEAGVLRRRVPFMENAFVIAGPADDSAGIADAGSPEEALHRIEESGASWVSRDDRSGTHLREIALFAAAGIDLDESRLALIRTGSGMGASLQVAGERRAYLLSDLGTFLAFRERTGLVAWSWPSESLRNVYSILQIAGERLPHPIARSEAEALERHLLSPEVQRRIAGFGRERFGRPLFSPLASLQD